MDSCQGLDCVQEVYDYLTKGNTEEVVEGFYQDETLFFAFQLVGIFLLSLFGFYTSLIPTFFKMFRSLMVGGKISEFLEEMEQKTRTMSAIADESEIYRRQMEETVKKWTDIRDESGRLLAVSQEKLIESTEKMELVNRRLRDIIDQNKKMSFDKESIAAHQARQHVAQIVNSNKTIDAEITGTTNSKPVEGVNIVKSIY